MIKIELSDSIHYDYLCKNQISKYTRSLKTLIYLLIILSQATRQVANATSYKIYIITIHIFCFYKAAATLLTFANLVI